MINRGHCVEWDEGGVQRGEDFTFQVKDFSV